MSKLMSSLCAVYADLCGIGLDRSPSEEPSPKDVAHELLAEIQRKRLTSQFVREWEALLSVPLGESQRRAQELASEVAAGSAELQFRVENYLMQVPLALRRVCCQLGQVSGKTFPRKLNILDPLQLAATLPGGVGFQVPSPEAADIEADLRDLIEVFAIDDNELQAWLKSRARQFATWTRYAKQGLPAAMTLCGQFQSEATVSGRDYDQAAGLKWLQRAADVGEPHALLFLGTRFVTGLGVPCDRAHAWALMRQAAAAGHAVAWFQLGVFREFGLGVSIDGLEAWRWYLRAAEAGVVHAQYTVGNYYWLGQHVAKNIAEAIQWLTRATLAGHRAAKLPLALMMTKESELPKDVERGWNMLLELAEAGELAAIRALAKFYLEGRIVARDPARAFELICQAAATGDATDLCQLGMFYHYGIGTQRDYQQAHALYLRAAQAGSGSAMQSLAMYAALGYLGSSQPDQTVPLLKQSIEAGHNSWRLLGHCYYAGFGVSRDISRAWECFQKGAAAGDIQALTDAGRIYLEGPDGSPDYHSAWEQFRRATEAGDVRAAVWMAKMLTEGIGCDPDPEQGNALLLQALDRNDRFAQITVASRAMRGENLLCSTAQALEWLIHAAEDGSQPAIRELIRCYEQGLGVAADPNQARSWREELSRLGDEKAYALFMS